MEPNETFLEGHSDDEKGAYLTAIASIATADRSASEEELEFIDAMIDTADLSDTQRQRVQAAANDTTGTALKPALDALKNSELRLSLITDLVAFAESDQNYTPEEKENIQKIAAYLNVDGEQFSTINQFVHKTAEAGVTPEDSGKQGFFGMENKFKSAGLNMGSISKGLLAIAGPLILSRMMGRRGGGLLGGLAGGGLAGMLGGMLGGGGGQRGGMGSLTSILNGGRGIGSAGGLLGRVLGGRF